jgi:hypothetical protein
VLERTTELAHCQIRACLVIVPLCQSYGQSANAPPGLHAGLRASTRSFSPNEAELCYEGAASVGVRVQKEHGG